MAVHGSSLRGSRRSKGWMVVRILLYCVLGAVALVGIRFNAYGIERASHWERVPFFSKAFGWSPDGRLAIEEYSRTDALVVGRMYWKVQILDPAVIDVLVVGLEPRGEGRLEDLQGTVLPWWQASSAETGEQWSACAENFMPCRSLWYDSTSREAFLAWEWG